MTDKILQDIIERLESKKRDCEAFSKKYKTRNIEDLRQYYEGANWAFTFALAQINELKND